MPDGQALQRSWFVRTWRCSANKCRAALHFEAVNHAVAKRDDLRRYVKVHGLTNRVMIPNDGETCTL